MMICQSCGMPMEENHFFGSNADGSKNEEYCKYCFTSGAFTQPESTFEEMVETCIPFLVQKGMQKEEAKVYLTENLKPLKRWSK